MYIFCYVSSAVSVKVSIYKQKTSVVNTVIMLLFVVTIKGIKIFVTFCSSLQLSVVDKNLIPSSEITTIILNFRITFLSYNRDVKIRIYCCVFE